MAGFLPGQPIGTSTAVGDIYKIPAFNNSKIEKLAVVENFGLQAPDLIKISKVDRVVLQSAKGVQVTAKLAGDAPSIPGSALAIEDAGLTVEFKSDSSYIFAAEELSYWEPRDMPSYLLQVKDAIAKKNILGVSECWVVTRVARVERYVLALSKGSTGAMELKVAGSASLSGIGDLASAEVSMKIVRTHNLANSIVSTTPAGLLFYAKKLSARGGAGRGAEKSNQEVLEFSDITDSDIDRLRY